MRQKYRTPSLQHSAHCQICHHPDRRAIEADFLAWETARQIAAQYGLGSYRAVYRHAHARGLFGRRRLKLRSGLDRIIEHAGEVAPSPAVIARVMRLGFEMDTRPSARPPLALFRKRRRARPAAHPAPASSPITCPDEGQAVPQEAEAENSPHPHENESVAENPNPRLVTDTGIRLSRVVTRNLSHPNENEAVAEIMDPRSMTRGAIRLSQVVTGNFGYLSEDKPDTGTLDPRWATRDFPLRDRIQRDAPVRPGSETLLVGDG